MNARAAEDRRQEDAAHASADGRVRAVIDRVIPEIDGGRFAVKRVVGDRMVVEAARLRRRPRRARVRCCATATSADGDWTRSRR